jgi:hypothetical protein
MLELNCQTCDAVFEATRDDAKNCSAACRSAFRRDRYSRERAYATGTLRRLVAAFAPVNDVLAEHATPAEHAELKYLASYARRLLAQLP